jgi:uncharacterized protein (DUF1684 family)
MVDVAQQQELAEFRKTKDDYFRRDRHAPLTAAQRRAFRGLVYYPHNPALRFELPLDRHVPDDVLRMETSTGDTQEYRRAGTIHFEVDGQAAELTIYRGEQGDLFLPLRDATSGKQTYGAGRYLEPMPLDATSVVVDFNYLYNPYCAYNDVWSCPLPPRENWLSIPLEAGEQRFHE